MHTSTDQTNIYLENNKLGITSIKCALFFDQAALNHGEREMVARATEGPIRRYTYRDLRNHALQIF